MISEQRESESSRAAKSALSDGHRAGHSATGRAVE
jgi:hypothetical protein